MRVVYFRDTIIQAHKDAVYSQYNKPGKPCRGRPDLWAWNVIHSRHVSVQFVAGIFIHPINHTCLVLKQLSNAYFLHTLSDLRPLTRCSQPDRFTHQPLYHSQQCTGTIRSIEGRFR